MFRYIFILLILTPITIYAADIDISGIKTEEAKDRFKAVNPGGSILDGVILKGITAVAEGANSSSSSFSDSSSYTCKFRCTGAWGSWRGPEHIVQSTGLSSFEAQTKVREAEASVAMCAKYPFHEGKWGGGAASVGWVSCSQF